MSAFERIADIDRADLKDPCD